MKKIIFAVLFCLMSSVASAQLIQVNIGNPNLDNYLTNLATNYALGKIAKDKLQDELNYSFGIPSNDFDKLSGHGFNAGEIYLLGLMHKFSNRPIEELIKHRKPGQGWGELAHQLGVHPSELNKMRVAMKKQWKEHKKANGKGKGAKHGNGHGKGKGKMKMK